MKIFASFFFLFLGVCLIVTFSMIGSGENAAESEKKLIDQPSADIPEIEKTAVTGKSGVEAEIPAGIAELKTIRVYSDGGTTDFEFEEYLCGTVFAEMPSSFEYEALKAQAVAARSYCVFKMLNQSENHRFADVCNDPGCCKAYISYADAVKKWGLDYIRPLWEKVRNAVLETEGEIIVYKNQPAAAVFHAMSGEMTETAENLWGGEIPYLVGVATPEEENSGMIDNFQTIEVFDSEGFKERILRRYAEADFSVPQREWVKEPEINSSGRVAVLEICGVKLKGAEVREIFSLRAADFTIEYNQSDDSFIFTVKGYGHGVGMSQYGANLLAGEGRDYEEILKWYYTGVELYDMYAGTVNNSGLA